MSAQSLLSFNGTSHYVDFETVLNVYRKDFSLEAWVLIENPSGVNRILSSERTNVGKNQFALIQNQDTVAFMIRGGVKGPSLWLNKKHILKAQIPTQQWTHVAVCRKGTLHQLFINGILSVEHKTASPINYQGNTVNLRIGAQHAQTGDGALQFFGGKVADLRIWSVALSPEAINERMHHCLNGSETGLMFYWPLNEGKGNTVIDAVKQSKGTLHGAVWQQEEVDFLLPPAQEKLSQDSAISRAASVLMFNGTSDYISVPDSPSLRVSNYTVELWLKASGIPNEDWKGIIGKPGRNHHIWLHRAGFIHHRFHTSKATNVGAPDTPNGSFPWDQWIHVAITNDGKTAKTYLNGELKAEGPTGGTLVVDQTALVIARDLDGGNERRYFKGQMTDIRVWDRVRSPQEITTHMNQRLRGNETGLVAYWPLNEGEGATVAVDKTGNGNNGTIHGGTWEQQALDILTPLPIPAEVDALPTVLDGSSQSVLSFNGTSDYIDTGLDAQPSALPNTTWEAWVKPAHGPASWDMILSTDDQGWDRFVGEREGQFQVSHGSGAWAAASSDIHQWQHIAVVYTSDKGVRFYKNGVETVFNGQTSFGGTTKPFFIGRSPWSAEQCYQGRICEVRVWNYARPQAEIQRDMYCRLTGQEEGLVGYWPLTEGCGTMVTNKVNNATRPMNGGTWETDQLPAAPESLDTVAAAEPAPTQVMNFDGSNDYIEVPYHADLNPKTFTISCWAKVMGGEGKWRSPVTCRADYPQRGYILYAGDNNKWQFWIGIGSQWLPIQGPDIVLNQWVHIAGTYDGKAMQFYVAGQPIGAAKAGILSLNPNCPLRIGAGTTEKAASLFFHGQIAEVRLWDHARSQEDIQADMSHRMVGNEPGLIGYWPLDGETSAGAANLANPDIMGTIHGAIAVEADDFNLAPTPNLPEPLSEPVSGALVQTQAEPDAAVTDQETVTDGITAGTAVTAGKTVTEGTDSVVERGGTTVLQFDGQDDYVEISPDPALDLTNGYTIEAWIKPATLGARLIDKGIGGRDEGFTFDVYPQNLRFINKGIVLSSPQPLKAGIWQHIAVTFETATDGAKLFVDGEVVQTATPVRVGSSTNLPIRLGSQADVVGSLYTGEMAEVRIWNVARSPEEIKQARFHRLKQDDEPDLVGYWPLDEGDGAIAPDQSNQDNPGTINGASWQSSDLPLAPKPENTDAVPSPEDADKQANTDAVPSPEDADKQANVAVAVATAPEETPSSTSVGGKGSKGKGKQRKTASEETPPSVPAPVPSVPASSSKDDPFENIVYLKVSGSDKRSSKSRGKKRKKRKKQTFSAYEKLVRKVAERQSDAASVYVERHKRSNRKKKNGWLKDFVKNYSKTLEKLYKL